MIKKYIEKVSKKGLVARFVKLKIPWLDGATYDMWTQNTDEFGNLYFSYTGAVETEFLNNKMWVVTQ